MVAELVCAAAGPEVADVASDGAAVASTIDDDSSPSPDAYTESTACWQGDELVGRIETHDNDTCARRDPETRKRNP